MKGPQGERGEKGETGAQGPAGADGAGIVCHYVTLNMDNSIGRKSAFYLTIIDHDPTPITKITLPDRIGTTDKVGGTGYYTNVISSTTTLRYALISIRHPSQNGAFPGRWLFGYISENSMGNLGDMIINTLDDRVV